MNTKVVFYGDDFTGATDNCAQFHRHGLKSLLFFENPEEAELARAARRYDVIGVAGTARSLATGDMAGELSPVFDNLKRVGARLMQYKCCSTFDSSQSIGSLGEAVRLMRACWKGSFVPVLAAMPEFGRYTLFGDHFARYGKTVHRLDRHPSMSHHPVTPMHEANLAAILHSQGFEVGDGVDLRELDAFADRPALLADRLSSRNSAVFDSYSERQILTAAGAIWELAGARPVTALAAQGLAYGLGRYLRETREISTPQPVHKLAREDRLLVLSGSCSPQSAAQIAWAEEHGFKMLPIHGDALLDPDGRAAKDLEEDVLSGLNAGRSVVAYTARGPGGLSMKRSGGGVNSPDSGSNEVTKRIGRVFAGLIRGAIGKAKIRRLVVAGGDSSSFAMRSLGARGLEIHASHFRQNAHVGLLLAEDRLVNGLEVLLKGGQVGDDDLYGMILDGF